VITDYAANRDSMSEDEANRLAREWLDAEKQRVDVKEDYLKKFQKEGLSARTTARFFQIDQKLDAAVDAALAAHIPLIY
jgi:hypothetical protein